jgi:hypothetical protein
MWLARMLRRGAWFSRLESGPCHTSRSAGRRFKERSLVAGQVERLAEVSERLRPRSARQSPLEVTDASPTDSRAFGELLLGQPRPETEFPQQITKPWLLFSLHGLATV